ncbi:glutathione S-transferase family protein [Phreatobacter stygius]|uniref:Glutathione S-transferase family protein n=1 Tax=Phreatobacter stygius TaxID=1940610 RepID=A0A4D7B2Q1_9HYPH|nr:glutathione S-transferase N-terminal domain-containing protein [Phreatobacter stygius]QCI67824.1 glutathione S-transferase family protein [Phreatobacter stygius]
MTPIQLHSYQTPNGHKASIMLEETGLPYQVHVVDIERGDQHAPDFLALNPNNKIPVIVDPDRNRTVFESGAILTYLAERSGRFLPANEQERLVTLQWLLFQAAHVGPTLGQLWNYKVFAAERIPSVIGRFEKETARVLKVMNGELGKRAFLAGDSYGIADIMTWPWIHAGLKHLGLDLAASPDVGRWYETIGARPQVRRGLAIPALGDRSDAA